MTVGQADDEFRGRLAVEVGAWQREGVITPEQAGRILARYELRTAAARAFRLGPVATFISIVGAIVLGTGVVYFFAANWELLPAWFKVLLVFGGTGVAYAAGYWLQFRWGGLPRVGAGLILLGAMLFQTGIFLLRQIYNMPLDDPAALLLGAVGIIPLAYAVRSRLALILGLADGLSWVGWTLVDTYHDLPEAMVTPLSYLLVGIMLYTAGSLHRLAGDRGRFVPVYQVLGLVTVLVPAYFLTFGGLWDEASRKGITSVDVPPWFGAAVLLALVAAATLLLGRVNDRMTQAEAAILGATALIVGMVAFVPRWAGGYAVLFNLLFFGLVLLACVRGYLEGEARYVNTGIPFLAIGLITRYFDWFWDLLPRSAFYIAGGIVLLTVAAGLERLRQRLLSGPNQPPFGGTHAEVRP